MPTRRVANELPREVGTALAKIPDLESRIKTLEGQVALLLMGHPEIEQPHTGNQG